MTFQLPNGNDDGLEQRAVARRISPARIAFAIIGAIIFVVGLMSIIFAWVPATPQGAEFSTEQLLDKGRYILVFIGLLIVALSLFRKRRQH